VYIDPGASKNSIGGVSPGAGNTIAFNQGAGVAVVGATTIDNPIRGNLIYRNTGLGIDLGGDGVMPNHLNEGVAGPNNFQNYPVLGLVTAAANSLSIAGSLNALPNQDYALDFYATAAAAADPSSHGGASSYLGSMIVTTFEAGNVSFVYDYAASLPLHEATTATATDAQGNISEFALNFINNQPPVAHITVDLPVVAPNDITVPAGTTVVLDATTSTDPNGDALSYTWTVDDNTTAAGRTAARTFLVPGQYTEYLIADDGFSGLSSDNLIVTFTPVSPSITGLTPSQATINEGDTMTLSGSLTDPDPTLSSTVTINWGDGSPATVVPLGVGVHTFNNVAHTYLDNPASVSAYPISVTVTTSDGQSGSASIEETLQNVSPTVTGVTLSAPSILEDGSVTLSGTIVDPGNLDSHTVVINWGDGLSTPTTLQLAAGQTSFSVTNTYEAVIPNGPSAINSISIVATDKDRGIGSAATSPNLTIPLALVGGPGNDTLVGGAVNDSLYCGPGNDSLIGNGGDNLLVGQHGDHTYVGGSGNDT
jgi:hypothetical protein